MFEQERVIVRLQQRVDSHPDIAACFLAGSYGRRADDGYSDLDVGLVFKDDVRRERVWGDRVAFVESVLPYVTVKSFDAVHIRTYFHIALYANGAKVDYRFETVDDLAPNPWDRDLRILKDTINWSEGFRAESSTSHVEPVRLTAQELTALDDRFWVMFWDVYRLLLRGDYQKPFTIYLQLLHFTLPPLLRILPPENPAHQALLRAKFSQDTEATAAALAALLDSYLQARQAVIEILHLDFQPNRVFETSMRRLVDRTK